jgi:hypothetical protein
MASFPTLRVSGTCFANTTIFKLMLLIISISISLYVSTGNRSSRILLLKLAG